MSTSYKMSSEYAGEAYHTGEDHGGATWSSDRMYVGLPSNAELQSRKVKIKKKRKKKKTVEKKQTERGKLSDQLVNLQIQW